MTDNHLVGSLRLASSCYTSDYKKLSSFYQCHGLPLSLEAISISQTQRFTIFISVLFSVWFISRWLVIKQIYVCVYVFKKGKVCDVTCEVWVVLRRQEGVVKLATAGWKRCEWVCVDIKLVDLGRVAAWKVDLGTKTVGHHCPSGYLERDATPYLQFLHEFILSENITLLQVFLHALLSVQQSVQLDHRVTHVTHWSVDIVLLLNLLLDFALEKQYLKMECSAIDGEYSENSAQVFQILPYAKQFNLLKH